jgi:hypothetical protein
MAAAGEISGFAISMGAQGALIAQDVDANDNSPGDC